MCWVSALIGMLVKTPQGVQAFGFIAFFPLVFGSNLLAPTATMPGWLQAFVKVNPMTLLTDAERGLLTGGPVATPAVQVAAVGARHLRRVRPAGRPGLPPPHLARPRPSTAG